MKKQSLKKWLILAPSIFIIFVIFFYYLAVPNSSKDIVTLILTLPGILGIIYYSKPSNILKYLLYLSCIAIVTLNFVLTGSFDAPNILLFVLLLVGVSL